MSWDIQYGENSDTPLRPFPSHDYWVRQERISYISLVLMIITMLGILSIILSGSYIYIAQGSNIHKLFQILDSLDKNEIVNSIEFIRSLNVTKDELKMSIDVGVRLMKAMQPIDNMSEFIQDIKYIVISTCKIVNCGDRYGNNEYDLARIDKLNYLCGVHATKVY